ncbi:MAG: glycosyltransferase family 4 protein [Candidatus Eisenbacteria bacterium]
MHIVCVHRGMYPERIGGTYSYIYELYKRLAGLGHRIDVIASTRRAQARPPFELEGIRVHEYAIRRVNPVSSTLQHLANTTSMCERLASESPVDVLTIHESQLGHRLSVGTFGRTVCQLPTFHAPVFLEFRFDTAWRLRSEPSALRRMVTRLSEPPLEYWQRRFERDVLEAAHDILVLSRYSRGHIEREFPSVDLGRVSIIPSGVDTGRFRPAADRSEVRARLGLEDETLHLLTVRKLAPRMGLEQLVNAMPEIVRAAAAKGREVRLTICGSGSLKATLESLIERLGLEGTVTLAGRVTDDDLVGHYQAADLFVLPTTDMEGFGISTVEALSTNTPVVGTPAGATPEILAAIDPRLLTLDTSSGAIATAVIEWLDWRTEETGTTRYRDEVLAKYDWDRVAERVEAYYAEKSESFARSRSG